MFSHVVMVNSVHCKPYNRKDESLNEWICVRHVFPLWRQQQLWVLSTVCGGFFQQDLTLQLTHPAQNVHLLLRRPDRAFLVTHLTISNEITLTALSHVQPWQIGLVWHELLCAGLGMVTIMSRRHQYESLKLLLLFQTIVGWVVCSYSHKEAFIMSSS